MTNLIICVPKLHISLIKSICWNLILCLSLIYFFPSLYFFSSLMSSSPRFLSSSDLFSLSHFSQHPFPSSLLLLRFAILPLHSSFVKMKLYFFFHPVSFHHFSPRLHFSLNWLSPSLKLILYFISSLTGIRTSGAADQGGCSQALPKKRCPTRGNGGDEGLEDNPGYVQVPPVERSPILLWYPRQAGRLLLGL